MHPDTIGLFKTALLALKEGESATVSLMELFPEHGFDLLENAYPTVVNFVMNWLMKLDFRQLYLFGVDMGFVDPKHHHSRILATTIIKGRSASIMRKKTIPL